MFSGFSIKVDSILGLVGSPSLHCSNDCLQHTTVLSIKIQSIKQKKIQSVNNAHHSAEHASKKHDYSFKPHATVRKRTP